jgi:hypothetical protein
MLERLQRIGSSTYDYFQTSSSNNAHSGETTSSSSFNYIEHKERIRKKTLELDEITKLANVLLTNCAGKEVNDIARLDYNLVLQRETMLKQELQTLKEELHKNTLTIPNLSNTFLVTEPKLQHLTEYIESPIYTALEKHLRELVGQGSNSRNGTWKLPVIQGALGLGKTTMSTVAIWNTYKKSPEEFAIGTAGFRMDQLSLLLGERWKSMIDNEVLARVLAWTSNL